MTKLKETKSNFQLHNRRYIGNKKKLIEWIFSIIDKECTGDSFTDIFAGTGVVAAAGSKRFNQIVVNDFLHSNHVIYKAFFGSGKWNQEKINSTIDGFNQTSSEYLSDNHFSDSFGGKYFSSSASKKIGFIRESIESEKENLTEREYYILLSSLIYSTDRIANTVGHYDAFFKKESLEDRFVMHPVAPIEIPKILIYREDANLLAKKIKTDIVYIDPPYNSRQYSRFYHVLETLVKWDNPELYGVALKPKPENMSDYCRVSAKSKFQELVDDIDAKYLVVSYNNTYQSKSNSSRNKIALEEIKAALDKKGETKVFEKEYPHFNTGNSDFKNHKEYLFVTRTHYELDN